MWSELIFGMKEGSKIPEIVPCTKNMFGNGIAKSGV